MTLSSADRKRYRAIGHHLKPVVTVAQKGLTENVGNEIERALSAHELIKVKLQVASREARSQLRNQICETHDAECVQNIGHVLLLFRAAKNPDPKLSNLIRDVS